VTRPIPIVAALLVLNLSACDSHGLFVPVGPHEIRLDLQHDFSDDLVVVELDGVRVYRNRVTTNHVLSVAALVPLALSEGAHRLRVSVNGGSATSAEFAAGEFPVLAVTYDPVRKELSLQLLEELPYYD